MLVSVDERHLLTVIVEDNDADNFVCTHEFASDC